MEFNPKLKKCDLLYTQEYISNKNNDFCKIEKLVSFYLKKLFG